MKETASTISLTTIQTSVKIPTMLIPRHNTSPAKKNHASRHLAFAAFQVQISKDSRKLVAKGAKQRMAERAEDGCDISNALGTQTAKWIAIVAHASGPCKCANPLVLPLERTAWLRTIARRLKLWTLLSWTGWSLRTSSPSQFGGPSRRSTPDVLAVHQSRSSSVGRRRQRQTQKSVATCKANRNDSLEWYTLLDDSRTAISTTEFLMAIGGASAILSRSFAGHHPGIGSDQSC